MLNTLWVELHQEMPRHPKTLALARELKISRREAVGMIIDLWMWAIHCADDTGLLAGVTDEDIALAVGDWPIKKAGALAKALQNAGWFDGANGAYVLHDWQDYTGRLYDRRKDAERKRESRRRAKVDTASVKCPSNVRQTSADNPQMSATNPRARPNPTQPNPTSSSQSDYYMDGQPPTVDIVNRYVQEIGGRVDAQRFVDYYATLGWCINGQPVRDWQALLRCWERSEHPESAMPTYNLADFEKQNVFDLVGTV